MSKANIHGTAVVVGDRGILITGASGSGKTTLALALLVAADAAGRFAALIADDQLLVSATGGRLTCSAPPAIAGLVEVFGRSPQRVTSVPSATIDLNVCLVPAGTAPRFAEDLPGEIAGCAVAQMILAERHATGALIAIRSWLKLPPFV